MFFNLTLVRDYVGAHILTGELRGLLARLIEVLNVYITSMARLLNHFAQKSSELVFKLRYFNCS